MPLSERRLTEVVCAVCGKVARKPDAWLRRVKTPTCSRHCNGQLRGQDWKAHAHKGRAAWTTEALASFREKMSGANNHAWKGGVTFKRSKGNYIGPKYVRYPIAFTPMARKDGYVMEHRLAVAMAVAMAVGRCLSRVECVHHVDHNPRNNALSNLMLFRTNRDHKLFEVYGSPLPIWRG